MADASDDNLFAAAREIAKSLGKDDTAAAEILQILSGYDSRLRPRVRPTLDRSIDSLERLISGYVASDHPIWSDPTDSYAFLDAVDELVASAGEWRPFAGDKSAAVCLSRADDLIQQAMFRLQDEFGFVMDRAAAESFDSDDELAGDEEDEEISQTDQVIVARPVTDHKIVIEALPSRVIADLNAICSRVYSGRRREFLEESLSRLRLRGLNMEEVQETPWRDLEDEIDRWTKAMTISFRVFFPSERLLSDRVFSGISSSVVDLSFMEVCRGATTQLLNFADAVAIGSRSPERLFKVMDIYEAVHDLMPAMETLFSDQYCSPMKHEAAALQKRLGEAIRGIFMELENLIRRDPAKTAYPGGGIHPITRYVMNYLRAACNSKQTLEQVMEETNKESLPNTSRPLSVQVGWVLELLESNLEAKSRVYRDPSLCFVFMMNNVKYILDKVTGSDLGSVLGDEWVVKHAAKLRQLHSNYRRSSWVRVVGMLEAENQYLKLIETLRAFKTRFEEICRIQSEWVVPDEQLKEELRSSVAGLVLPAYGKLIGKLKESPEVRRRGEPYIGYSVEDLEVRIKGLFKESSN
ncbi:PREDICTED: exocyst complex component EXO70B1 [Tarenaya hassleriana]|uniref:exocyst complex component EXO70B1 n=1 Tax=Tarenaya hassleriana TaxID=28532 RepID=UPI00053C655E|nr:PREDICTED: exocyst complex component EXO70B1 [Tarenaya hassleriana]